MSPEEFTRQLPRLTNNPLPIKPPFLFNGMSARVFPLRANLDTLQQLCDGYLNFIPPEAGHFRAMMPYVMLMVLDYGQVAESVTRIGWFSQLEVFFSVPVEWYKFVDGQWVFQDWGVITPYIFVNDSFSIPLGRTVYGFPKVMAKVTPAPSQWIENPVSPITLARVETAVFPKAYAGRRLEMMTLLDVDRDAPMSNLRIPFDPHSPITPWTIASHLATAVGGFGRDLSWLMQAMRISPVNPLNTAGVIPEMLARLAPAMSLSGSGFALNSLNLKQFRRADDPSRICYQALTNGQMRMTAFNGGGLLGEERTLLGDLSGGHTIKLHDHSSLPITRTLGLEVHRHVEGQDGGIAEIKPVMPFWIDINVSYEEGTNLAWRDHEGVWKGSDGGKIDPSQTPAEGDTGPLFNSSVASAVEAVAGPFEFANTTIRVLPLGAKRNKLQAFLDEFINEPLRDPVVREDDGKKEQVRLSVWARPPAQVNTGEPIGGDTANVFLTASSFADVSSKSNNVGDWAKAELAFLIPVKWERKGADGEWLLEGVGLVPAYTLVDDNIAAISRFEVQGIDARTAVFVRPESVWLQEGQTTIQPTQKLLRVDAEVWAAYGAGQKAEIQTVVEISHRDPDAGLGNLESRDTPFLRAEYLRRELGTKKGTKTKFPKDMKVARALALELLGNRMPFSLYTLKQFRDVTDPDKACYQELVRVPRVVKELFDIREIEETIVVRIHDYPSLSIVETLGIESTVLPDSGTGIVYSAQAERPFFIRATLDEPLAERLMGRVGTKTWKLTPRAFQTLLSDADGAPNITVDEIAETRQDQLDPSHMAAIMFQAAQRAPWSPAERLANNAPSIDKAAARQALSVTGPQVIVDSILSREWGNADPNARWRQGRRELKEMFSSLSVAGDARARAEQFLYVQENNKLAIRPGAVAGFVEVKTEEELRALPPRSDGGVQTSWQLRWVLDMEKNILLHSTFTELQLKVEANFNVISAAGILGVAPEKINELYAARYDLIQSLTHISLYHGIVTPSDLDTRIGADKQRFLELLSGLRATLDDLAPDAGGDPVRLMETTRNSFEAVRHVVDLARRLYTVESEAMIDKLARAYQKPDFCIRRDAIGPNRDSLLPRSLSWDEDWYYGKIITRTDLGIVDEPGQPAPPVAKSAAKPAKKGASKKAAQNKAAPKKAVQKKATKQRTKTS